MPPVAWVGTKEITQQKLQWTFSSERSELIVPFSGTYVTLLANRPKPGQQLNGFQNTGMKIEKVEVQEGDGETGTMYVSLGAPEAPDDTTSFDPLGEPIYEIDFSELSKTLEAHPDCGILKPDRPEGNNGRKKDWGDWADLSDDDYDADGGWSLAVYKAKKERGIDSFLTATVTIRRTIYYFRNPGGVGQGCFSLETPPAQAGAPTLLQGQTIQWLKTTDRLVREGRLRTRSTEWQGAHEWDDDIYD